VCREQSSLVFLSLDDFIEVGHSFPKDMVILITQNKNDLPNKQKTQKSIVLLWLFSTKGNLLPFER